MSPASMLFFAGRAGITVAGHGGGGGIKGHLWIWLEGARVPQHLGDGAREASLTGFIPRTGSWEGNPGMERNIFSPDL